MPKLTNRPPKYARFKRYAVIYHKNKRVYLGLYGSEESKIAYARFIAENRANPIFYLPPKEAEKSSATVSDLAAAFLDHAGATLAKQNYDHHKRVVRDFLLKLYGDNTLVDEFKPSCLKLIRSEMIQSQCLCRKMINDYISRIVRIFSWGVEEELVDPNTALALKAIKPLPPGYPGTFDHAEREHVPDEIIRRTLPFMPPVLRALIQVQRLTGCRPSEIFGMRVGQIDRTRENGLWYYVPQSHKTEKKIKRKKIVPLGEPEQKLLTPYLENKTPEQNNPDLTSRMKETQLAYRSIVRWRHRLR